MSFGTLQPGKNERTELISFLLAALQPITDDNGGQNVVGAGTLTFGGVNEEEFIGPLK